MAFDDNRPPVKQIGRIVFTVEDDEFTGAPVEGRIVRVWVEMRDDEGEVIRTTQNNDYESELTPAQQGQLNGIMAQVRAQAIQDLVT